MRRATVVVLRATLVVAVVLAVRHWTGARPPRVGRASGTPAWDLLTLARADPVRPAGRIIGARQAYGETRAVVATPIPDSFTYVVTIPAGAALDLGYAVQALVFPAEAPDLAVPTRLQVEFVDAAEKAHSLLDRTVDIHRHPADRRWFDVRVDLAPYAGATGHLTFRASTAESNPGPTSALFSAPRILVPPAADEPNLLLVTIDCLRADHVGAYGYPRPTTPTIDALSAEGVRFAHAYSTAPMTIPSVPQLFTSTLFPAEDQPTFLTAVNGAGIPSAAFVHNVWIILWLTLGRGPAPPDGFDELVSVDARGNAITDRALEWLDRHRDDRFALYLHYLDAHSPYRPRPRQAALFRDPHYAGPVTEGFDAAAAGPASSYSAADRLAAAALYDAGVRYVDDELARLVRALRADGRLDRTVIAVTADHGEEFGQHGGFFHGRSLHEELIHVPLVVRLPGAAHAGTVVERQVRALDVAPALLDWGRLPAVPALTGRSLAAALARPGDQADDVVATATNPQFPTRYALRRPPWKVIEEVGDGSVALYATDTDPAELHDIHGQHDAETTRLVGDLRAARAVLARRGYQVVVIGSPARAVPYRLTLEEMAATGSLATMDRIGDPSGDRVTLTTDGRTLELQGAADARPRGVRFDRPSSPLGGSAQDSLQFTLDVDGAPSDGTSVRLGSDGHAPSGDRIALDASLESPATPPCPTPDAGVRVCLWRYPTALTPVGSPAVHDAATRERLRALGYAQ